MASKKDYGYAVARLKAMEDRLLDEAFFARLLESQSLEAAIKALSETHYSAAFMELKSPSDFDSAIDGELARTYRDVASFVPDEALVTLCRLLYDVHNAKVVMKGAMMSDGGTGRRLDLLSPLGSMDTDGLVLTLEGGEWGKLPWNLGECCRQAQGHWDQHHDMQAVECLIDRGYYRALLDIASGLDMDLVTAWAKARIDGDNVKSLLRLSRLQLDPGAVEAFLHPGGTIDTPRLKSLLAEPVENWSRELQAHPIGRLLESFQEGGAFSTLVVRFERDLDDYISSVLAPSKFGTFEPANVVRYLWAREVETKNLRIVLVAVASGVNRETIRGLLRHV
ncbi:MULTISPECIES: V-type ATPase subunit [Jonquetella]|uniref:Vacuolar-type H+-ATPase subunit C n=1 Tax=Jonquetella anthropi DSM 22815 TaxID=885272 RepID=H0UMA2_9BACT|nr:MULTISPECIES: V-type ATPase subunit [Jonquetella]EHM12575.1 vacuolar-type H+-ATPase subunit C [Jonquetella anthropi DSM 22815]ERL24714.1 ATP synthase, subunit C [Jonquetella sp. BV3C21]